MMLNPLEPSVFNLTIEVAGCPTTCMHCWAQGAAYASMPLDDIRRTLEAARTFCDANNLELLSFPMHEVASHPQAIEVLRLFQDIVTPGEKFVDPLPTTGVPLAIRDDWRELLGGLRGLGITALFFAWHGLGETHDRAVNRAGAFVETCLAVKRAHAAGFQVGANIFVTKEDVSQTEELARTLATLGIGDAYWDVARYSPVARLRRSEYSRVELSDVLPVAGTIAELSPANRELWTNLESCTEAAYVSKALENEATFDYFQRSGIRLVCRGNGDVFAGDARLYGRLLGNLKTDGAERVFVNAVAHGPVSDDFLHFGTDDLPSISELARTVGNPRGQRIYFDAASMRYCWLDENAQRKTIPLAA